MQVLLIKVILTLSSAMDSLVGGEAHPNHYPKLKSTVIYATLQLL